MLKETPPLFSMDMETMLRLLTEHLHQTGWALVAFLACGVIALGATLKVVSNLRAEAGRKVAARCKWKKDKLQPYDELKRWICTACGGIGFSDTSRPPVNCRRYDPRSKF